MYIIIYLCQAPETIYALQVSSHCPLTGSQTHSWTNTRGDCMHSQGPDPLYEKLHIHALLMMGCSSGRAVEPWQRWMTYPRPMRYKHIFSFIVDLRSLTVGKEGSGARKTKRCKLSHKLTERQEIRLSSQVNLRSPL